MCAHTDNVLMYVFVLVFAFGAVCLCVWPAGCDADACWLQIVCIMWVCSWCRRWWWVVFSLNGLNECLQASASPWQQVLGYNLSVKLNGAWVTRPWAGVPPVSPITSARPVACVAPSPADTYSIFIMWKKPLRSSTWLPQNNRAHFNSCT